MRRNVCLKHVKAYLKILWLYLAVCMKLLVELSSHNVHVVYLLLKSKHVVNLELANFLVNQEKGNKYYFLSSKK